jgi:hypothetical protein
MAEDKKEIIKKLNEDLDLLNDSLENISKTLSTQMSKQFSALKDDAEEFVEAFSKGENITKKLNDKLLSLKKTSNQLGVEKIRLESDYSKALASSNVKEQNRITQKITQNKLATQQLESTQTILVKLAQINAELEKENSLLTKTKEAYDSLEKSIANQIGFSLTLSGIFSAILQAAFKIDAQVVELSKSLGVSKEEAGAINDEFNSYAISLGDGFTTLNKLTQAQSELTKQIGVAVKYTNEEVGMFAKLTGLYGLTADEAGNLTRYSASHGKNIKEYTGSLLKASKLAQIETGTRFDQREILQDISKLSSGILVKFQGNPKALAAAVVEAKKLGTNLETVDKIGESLLNFESSIENELKAELLTGKQINLEKARYAALTGNQLDLTREITSQVGTLNEYENLNVLAQKSLAEAFGLSREEMSEMLLKQEAINKYGADAAELNAQELENLEKSGKSLEQYLTDQSEQVTAQEKFNTLIENLQTSLGKLADGPLINMINGFVSLLDNATALYAMIGLIGGIAITKMIVGLTTSIALQRISTSLAKEKAGTEIVGAGASAAASAAAIPGIGFLIAGGVAAALIGALLGYMAGAGKGDDIMSEGGYGKRTLLSPEGAIKLNDKDTVIAGTNLGGGGNDNINQSIDLTPMISAINEVRSAVDRLYNKDTSINMDGKKVGNTLTQGSYKVA